MNCSMPGFPVHHQLSELAQTHVCWVDNAIQPFHPLSPLLLLPSIFFSIRVFSSGSALHIRWPKYWSFSFSSSPSNEYSGPISFRIDWLDRLAVQGTLKSLLQHHSSKASNTHIHTCMHVHAHTHTHIHTHTELPRWCSCKEYTYQSRRHRRQGFHPSMGMIPWRRKWQLTPVFLPRKVTDT